MAAASQLAPLTEAKLAPPIGSHQQSRVGRPSRDRVRSAMPPSTRTPRSAATSPEPAASRPPPPPTPAYRTPVRDAYTSDPSPRVREHIASQLSARSRRACEYTAACPQPIAIPHAPNGAGPTLASHFNPATVDGPGLTPAIPNPSPHHPTN